MVPEWFPALSLFMLGLGAACSAIIVLDVISGHRQQMWIMNIVWPVTALFGTLLVIWFYFTYGRLATKKKMTEAKQHDDKSPHQREIPFPAMVAKGAAHCGAGCTLGDICAEFLASWFPIVATWVGWKSIFPDTPEGKVFAVWVLDYLFAFAIGVGFQYFTIVLLFLCAGYRLERESWRL